jgi:ABC-2 type transport system ATP-binding protein
VWWVLAHDGHLQVTLLIPIAAVAVAVRDLRKWYADLEAVRGVSFEVRRGEIFALLGPNGAGKTSVIEILEGYRPRTAGEASVLGVDPGRPTRRWRERIGLVLQESELDPNLTVRETVSLFAGFYPAPRPVAETIRLAGLEEVRDRRAGALSGGERRRLDVAVGIVGDPELIFLDEPTTGFDPSARHAAWSTISDLRELGKTILLTTHYMDEAQQLADRVVVIARGRVIAEGTPDSLGRDGHAVVSFRLPAYAEGLPLPDGALAEREHVSFTTETPTRDLAPILAWAAGRGMELEGLAVGRPSLEDVYLQLTEESR